MEIIYFFKAKDRIIIKYSKIKLCSIVNRFYGDRYKKLSYDTHIIYRHLDKFFNITIF